MVNKEKLENDEMIKKIAKEAVLALDDKKGEDIKIIDISEVSVIADYFIIASGNNQNQIQRMADEVEERIHKMGLSLKQVEGYETANWILMDFSDVIVHIFNKENRLFYDLERIWRDGRIMDMKDFLQ